MQQPNVGKTERHLFNARSNTTIISSEFREPLVPILWFGACSGVSRSLDYLFACQYFPNIIQE